LTADRDGFSLNAAVSCQPCQQDRLERLCRYVTRPAICLERFTVRADGKIQYELKHPFRGVPPPDGTTHILFSLLDFLSKLAALVPRPCHNLVRYHSVFAPNSKMRQLIVPKRNRLIGKVKKGNDKFETTEKLPNLGALYAHLTWAERLRRVFNMMGPPSDCHLPPVW